MPSNILIDSRVLNKDNFKSCALSTNIYTTNHTNTRSDCAFVSENGVAVGLASKNVTLQQLNTIKASVCSKLTPLQTISKGVSCLQSCSIFLITLFNLCLSLASIKATIVVFRQGGVFLHSKENEILEKRINSKVGDIIIGSSLRFSDVMIDKIKKILQAKESLAKKTAKVVDEAKKVAAGSSFTLFISVVSDNGLINIHEIAQAQQVNHLPLKAVHPKVRSRGPYIFPTSQANAEVTPALHFTRENPSSTSKSYNRLASPHIIEDLSPIRLNSPPSIPFTIPTILPQHIKQTQLHTPTQNVEVHTLSRSASSTSNSDGSDSEVSFTISPPSSLIPLRFFTPKSGIQSKPTQASQTPQTPIQTQFYTPPTPRVYTPRKPFQIPQTPQTPVHTQTPQTRVCTPQKPPLYTPQTRICTPQKPPLYTPQKPVQTPRTPIHTPRTQTPIQTPIQTPQPQQARVDTPRTPRVQTPVQTPRSQETSQIPIHTQTQVYTPQKPIHISQAPGVQFQTSPPLPLYPSPLPSKEDFEIIEIPEDDDIEVIEIEEEDMNEIIQNNDFPLTEEQMKATSIVSEHYGVPLHFPLSPKLLFELSIWVDFTKKQEDEVIRRLSL